ncbi:FliH/SctL family protein, partial [Actinotalea sp. JY-7885]
AAEAQAGQRASLAAAVAVLERAAAAAEARTVPVVEEVRRGVQEAGLALAEAVLRRELTPGPTSARAVLERALAVPAGVDVHTVRLNPADLAHVRALLAEAGTDPADGVRVPQGVQLVADAGLAPGDAVSEHPTGFLDAQVATALARAREALLGEDL